MFRAHTPSTLLTAQLQELRRHLPCVRDGQPAAIHDGRVATRRIRELLLLFGGDRGARRIDDLLARFQQIGRSLGRVRDADVRICLLRTFERRIPHAAPTLVVLRQRAEGQRLALARTLIKNLEQVEAIALVDTLLAHRWVDSSWRHFGRTHTWQRQLRRALSERSRTASDAIEHATGVYFPNRTHRARIAIKKLRYTIEFSHELQQANLATAIADVKKVQDILGDLHDRQALLDELRSLELSTHDHEQVSLLCQVIDAEAHHLHTRYLERRVRALDVCRLSNEVARAESRVTPSMTAIIVISSAGYLIAKGLGSRSNREALSAENGEVPQASDANVRSRWYNRTGGAYARR